MQADNGILINFQLNNYYLARLLDFLKAKKNFKIVAAHTRVMKVIRQKLVMSVTSRKFLKEC
jgi:hypothetical protein